jgi:phosphoglycolate phosphatase-like HAD superfamily hydrolase
MGDLSDSQIKEDAQQQLNNWDRKHDNVVFIDTDGCVLDNMWAKQVGVFHPLFIEMFGLKYIEPFFRIHAEFHNLWGKTRGEDRFLAIQDILNSLLKDTEAKSIVQLELFLRIKKSVDAYIQWIDDNDNQKLGVPSLTTYHKQNGTDYIITILLAWAEAVNRTFEYTTIKMPPFNYVKETIEKISEHADILVISSTPYGDLKMWWENVGLKQYLTTIGSKEMGAKVELIRLVMKSGGYEINRSIMIGDGGKDKSSALDNNILFLGTIPGKEEQIWQESIDKVFTPLFNNNYKGSEYEKKNIEEFDNALKEKGPWELPGYDAKTEYLKLQSNRIATYKELGLPLEGLFTY